MENIKITLPITEIPISGLIAQVSQKLHSDCNPKKDRLRLKKYQRNKGVLHLKYEILKDTDTSTQGDDDQCNAQGAKP